MKDEVALDKKEVSLANVTGFKSGQGTLRSSSNFEVLSSTFLHSLYHRRLLLKLDTQPSRSNGAYVLHPPPPICHTHPLQYATHTLQALYPIHCKNILVDGATDLLV